MIDYYKELNLNRDSSAEELNKSLSQLESTWKRREINNPEKAHKILSIIDEARNTFRTEQSKAEYDRSLDAPHDSTEKLLDTTQKFLQWKAAANEYFSKGQYDLAEAALDKAFVYTEANEDEELLVLAANIYHNDGKFDAAITYINNALLINSNSWFSYALKAITFVDIGRYKQQGIYHGSISSDDKQLFNDALAIYELGLEVAKKAGDIYGEGFIQGHKAFLLYNTQGKEAAQESLAEALRLGDPSGQGKIISDAIEKVRHNECHYSIDYYPCAPIASKEQVKGLFYTDHTMVLDEVESALIFFFLGKEVTMTYDSYNLRHQHGGREIEDREECWYDWNIPNEGKVQFHLMEHAPESFNDGGLTKLTMTYDGSNDGLPAIKEKLDQALEWIRNSGIEVMQEEQIRAQKESRIVQYRRSLGRCIYCGHQFKGLVTKRCSNCGRLKNY